MRSMGGEMTPEQIQILSAIGMIAAALIGPISAVLITLFWEKSRRAREQKQTVLQTLLATQGRAADPAFSWAIRTAPMHFATSKSVMEAHSCYLDAVRLEPTPKNQITQDQEIGRRLGILISEVLKDLGYKGLTSEQLEMYTAKGLAERERLIESALQALPYIAFNAKRSADYAEAMTSKVLGGDDPANNLPNSKTFTGDG